MKNRASKGDSQACHLGFELTVLMTSCDLAICWVQMSSPEQFLVSAQQLTVGGHKVMLVAIRVKGFLGEGGKKFGEGAGTQSGWLEAETYAPQRHGSGVHN